MGAFSVLLPCKRKTHICKMGLRDMSRGKLCCLACCGVTVIVLAVMIPVTLFSIMPSMARSSLVKGTINITNSTVYMPINLTVHPWVYQETHATMHNDAPFEVTMKAFTQTMTAVDWRDMGCFGPSREVQIGQVVFPEIKLKHGTNDIHVFMNITVNNSQNDECAKFGPFTCFQIYSIYTAQFGGPGALQLTSDDARVKTLGITIPGSFHTDKRMECYADASPQDPLNLSAVAACQESGGCLGPNTMRCEQVPEFNMVTTTAKPTASIVV